MLYFWNMTGFILTPGSADKLDRVLGVLRDIEADDTVLVVEGYPSPVNKPVVIPLRVRITRVGIVELA